MTTRPENDDGEQPSAERPSGEKASTRDLPSHIVGAMMSGPDQWKGPLPPRELFVEYDKEFPGASEEILRIFAKQVEYRNELARRTARSVIISRVAYLLVAVVITIVTLIAAFALRAQQEDLLALITALAPGVAGLVGLGTSYLALRRNREHGGGA